MHSTGRLTGCYFVLCVKDLAVPTRPSWIDIPIVTGCAMQLLPCMPAAQSRFEACVTAYCTEAGTVLDTQRERV